MKFLDRTDERERLTRLLDGRAGAFACLYGRRRCGKTRLLKECVRGRSSVVYFLADRSERSSQIARFAKEASAVCPALAAAATAEWGPILDLWTAVSPRGAILVLARLSTFASTANFFRGETPRDGAVCRESSRIAFRNAV